MSTLYSCPSCGANISTDDVNVATDVALCRTCGETTPFSALANTVGQGVDLSAPPPHLSVGITEEGDSVMIYQKRSGIIYFLIPFTLLWGGGAMVALVSDLTKGFDPKKILFVLPFLVGTVILVSVTAFLAKGRTEIVIGNGIGYVFLALGKYGWKRTFAFNATTRVSLELCGVEVNNVPKKAVTVVTDGKKTQFAALITDEAKQYVAACIQKAVSSLHPRIPGEFPDSTGT